MSEPQIQICGECKHDFLEREGAVLADGFCPLCQANALVDATALNVKLITILQTLMAASAEELLDYESGVWDGVKKFVRNVEG